MPIKEKTQLVNFEDAIKELNEIVEKMEHGGLPLEKSLEYFERGIKLTRECQQLLQNAEQRVQVLMQQNNKAELSDFDVKSDD
jgi:exodeoxyribonuclease VII small subunit